MKMCEVAVDPSCSGTVLDWSFHVERRRDGDVRCAA